MTPFATRFLALSFALATIGVAAAASQPPSLPPLSGRTIDYSTHEVTWPSLDVSPDGATVLFDILGDIFALDKGGGIARPLMTGAAFDTQPVFSPDGRHIAFISDRSSVENLWVADADGTDARQISADEAGAPLYSSPAWSPDGRTVYASRMTYGVLAFELWSYDVVSRKAVRLTKAKPEGNESHEQRRQALGVAASPDGNYLYYSVKTGTTWTEHKLPHWQIVRRDLRTDTDEPFITSPGGAMQPALSHDGRMLIYATRERGKTGLRLRRLDTGDDRPLLFPIDPDGQEGGYYAGLLPRYTFAPDDRSIVLGLGGGIKRLDLASRTLSPILFTAAIHHEMGPQLRVQQRVDRGPVHIRIIQQPHLSPDGKHIAFGAAGRIYIADRAGGKPHPLDVEEQAWQPSWSPDGRFLTYVTWNAANAGQVWVASAEGAPRARRITSEAAYYTEPTFTADGNAIVALRTSQYDRLHSLTETDPATRQVEIISFPTAGGKGRIIAQASGARGLRPDPDSGRVRFLAGGWVNSVALDTGEVRRIVRIVAQVASQYFPVPAPPQDVRLNADGTQALVRTAFQAFVVPIPHHGDEPPVLNIDDPKIGARQFTTIGADFIDWAPDGRTVCWSLGNAFRTLPLERVLAAPPRQGERLARTTRLDVVLPRDVPHGTLLLRGAKVATMRGDQIIDHADILIVDDRIAAVGAQGSFRVPAGATVRDISGKFVVPGFVDEHAHYFETRRDILDIGHWDFAANLAYGVTSGLEVQSFDPDIFSYADMIDAGLMVGPHVFSTGPGVFVNSDIRSRADAVAVLTRYRDYYHTRNIKEYMVGNRAQRRYLIEAAADLGMMPTTEGASDWRLDITQMLDGYPGNEHALPIAPLHDDVMQMLVRTRISYAPTLLVLYGAPPALSDMVIRHQADIDAKLRRFLPGYVIAARTGSRDWFSPDDQQYPRFAAQAIAIQRAGGLLGVGAHGMVQGLGYHWELEAQAAGGATPLEVLHAATIGSAEVIGRALDIGSIEPGKFADLLIMDRDPTVDIRNTRSLAMVMKAGRLYAAATLDELWPRQRRRGRSWFASDSALPPHPAAQGIE